jgi:hypothetical protein
MIYRCLLIDEADKDYSCRMTVEAKSEEAARLKLEAQNPGKTVVHCVAEG